MTYLRYTMPPWNLLPIPPALVESKKTESEASLLKVSIKSCRSLTAVDPSNLRNSICRWCIKCPIRSNIFVHWLKMRILCPFPINSGRSFLRRTNFAEQNRSSTMRVYFSRWCLLAGFSVTASNNLQSDRCREYGLRQCNLIHVPSIICNAAQCIS